MNFITFEKALTESENKAKHILLGNGFSIACRPDLFHYTKLWEEAKSNGSLDGTEKVFESLKTSDFEKVIRSLRDTCKTLESYPDAPREFVEKLRQDAEALRETLVQTIAKNHPDYPSEISDDEYKTCRKFLKNFDRFFTTSYDLLLYWAIMHEPGPEKVNKRDDGFRKPVSNPDADYVSWEPYRSWYQNTFYLHGALHIFDTQTEIKKYTWNNTEVRLIDQIRDALDREFYPIFISEGRSEEKYAKIRHSDFLSASYTKLSILDGVLFTFGHSLGEGDKHIIDAIARSKVSKVYIGIHGDKNSESNQRLIETGLALPRKRMDDRYDLDVYFYDSTDVNVWK
ncbi:DUF4917 family protein [Coraliomargarita sp. W4R53]